MGSVTTITDFLNYLRPNRHIKTFNLSLIFSELAFMFGHLLRKDGIQLIIEDVNNIFLTGVQNTLFEALLNIISNSKDAYLANPSAQKKEIVIKTKKLDFFITITIEDFAGGADDEVISKMFNAYFTTKSEEKGSGLGLYITKSIIERDFAGSITAHRNKTNDGLCIEITIPTA